MTISVLLDISLRLRVTFLQQDTVLDWCMLCSEGVKRWPVRRIVGSQTQCEINYSYTAAPVISARV